MLDDSAHVNGGGQPGFNRGRVRHVIVLMMENRSFDHVLGFLQHPDRSYPRLSQETCPLDPSRPEAARVQVSDDAKSVLGTDPDHAHEAVMLQVYGHAGAIGADPPQMNGFIKSYAYKIDNGTIRQVKPFLRAVNSLLEGVKRMWGYIRRKPRPVPARALDIMKCFSEVDTPVLATLAKEFAVCVNWHSSVPGETWPNRNFAHAATSDGAANIELRFYDNDTVFDRLSGPERRWRIYHDGVPQVWAFPRLWRDGTDGFGPIDDLVADIRTGDLPAYSFVEPHHGVGAGQASSQHPGQNLTSGDCFVAGEALMAKIYNALRANKKLFAETLLLITYDEHGGFYDHVAPKAVPSPDDKVGSTGFDFTLSGIRVPAVIVSPLIPRGTIDTNFYDHASIPKLVLQQFAPSQPPLTKRDAAARNPLAALPLLPEPREDCPEIDIPAVGGRTESSAPQRLTSFEASLVELTAAVKTQIEQPGIAGRSESLGTTIPFNPDPELAAAARSGILVPGSNADQAIDDVISLFAVRPRPDPADIEFG